MRTTCIILAYMSSVKIKMNAIEKTQNCSGLISIANYFIFLETKNLTMSSTNQQNTFDGRCLKG